MSRRSMLLAATLGTVACAAGAATALGAGSPAIAKETATQVNTSSAVLRASINPGGSGTNYYFQWGLTAGYGANGPVRFAGTGTKSVTATTTASSLLPGTVYHFRVVAANSFGQTVGSDHTFRTAGHPPPGVVTGPATGVGRNSATLTGVINPNGQVTGYEFQYGTTTAYGSATTMATVPAGSAAVNVASVIPGGLEAGTVFHYRLVAFHGTTVAQSGGDATFLTEPFPRYRATLKASTQPRRARRAPYVLTTFGHLGAPSSTPASLACSGNVRVRMWNGRRRVSQAFPPVQPDCNFSLVTGFRRLPRHRRGQRSVRLKVVVRFLGNGYLAPRGAADEFVILGR